ncbi:MAG: ATP-binding protein [Desulfobacterales bacterium]|nr:ATP-binding protein [Desulfobacterales bacterium]
MQNPYTSKNMLPHNSDMFFGRTQEIKQIEDLLLHSESPQSVSIIGERRIGKSSLANRVFHRVTDAENTVAVFLDCDGMTESCNSRDDFFKIMGDHADGVFSSYSSFKRFIESQSKNGKGFIVFLDEFERLTEKAFADDTFFSNLRAIANHAYNRLAMVTISQKRLNELTHSKAIKSSEFWNIFTTKPVGLLDDKDVVGLRLFGFQKNSLLLEEEELKTIDYYAGNFPFFNQIACRHLFDTKVGNFSLNKSALETELLDYYKKLWEHRSKPEQNLLKSPDKTMVKQDLLLPEMEIRGLVKKVKDFYVPFSEYFCRLISGYFKVERKLPDFEKTVEKTKKVLTVAKEVKDIVIGKDKKK